MREREVRGRQSSAELGLTVHACDIDLRLATEVMARQRTIGFFMISEDDPTLPIADQQVSAVTCCDVIEHMPAASRVHTLREMHRILRPDGALILTVPHKGLFAALDPENVKFHFPRAHRFLFTLFRGAAKYEQRYRGERFGNFSSGMQRHMHFSLGELDALLGEAGYRIEAVRFFTLLYPFTHSLLWIAEALDGRFHWRWLVPFARTLYTWDSDLEPGRLAFSIGVRARPVDSEGRPTPLERPQAALAS